MHCAVYLMSSLVLAPGIGSDVLAYSVRFLSVADDAVVDPNCQISTCYHASSLWMRRLVVDLKPPLLQRRSPTFALEAGR